MPCRSPRSSTKIIYIYHRTVARANLAPFRMPGASIVHAAAFAVGALVGGGAMAVVSARRQQYAPPAPVPTVAPTTQQPVVDVKPGGVTRISSQVASSASVLPPVLKHGSPGTSLVYYRANLGVIAELRELGPVSDQLVRTAYVAGYDRRLRHPAWVRHTAAPSVPYHSHLPADGGASHIGVPREVASRPRVQRGEGRQVELAVRGGPVDTGDVPREATGLLPERVRPGTHVGDSVRTVCEVEGWLRRVLHQGSCCRLQDLSGCHGRDVPADEHRPPSGRRLQQALWDASLHVGAHTDFGLLDWAYLEDWCRRLTSTSADVYVFTIPLYLPKLDSDGKWRIVSIPYDR